MTITRNFKLCLNAGTQNAPYINANQYDEGEEWVFDLYTEGGQKFTPSTGAIIGIKSDGNAILNSGTVNSDGQVVITETQQMTAASGLAVFELLIEGETHGTANFIVNVERRPSDDAEFSDSDLSLLQEAVNSASEIEDLLGGQDVPTVITPIISDWLDENITNPSNPPIDTSLTVAGAAADAKVTGDEITDLKSAFDAIATVGATSAQMVDSSKYVDGYRWDTTAGSDIDAAPVAASGWTIINQQFFIDTGTTIGISTNSEIVVLGYAYDSNTDKYTRSAFIQSSSFVVDGDHYKYTFANNIRAFKVYISTAALNLLTTPLIIAINSEWDGNPNYGQVSDAKINPNVEIPQINSLQSSINAQIETMQTLDLSTLEDGYINSASGRAMDATSYKRTGFVHVQADTLKVAITFAVASVGFAFYDSRKKYISGFDYTGYSVGDMRDVDVPVNAYYFRYCALNANVDKMLVLVPNYANAVSRIDENPCFYNLSSECRTFKKILCIGDSLTAGQFDYKENGVTKEFNDQSYSYPTFLKAITGRDTTNAGDAGETTVSWYEIHQNDDLSGHDACIIMLGRNDYVTGRETTSEQRATAFANIITKVRNENPQIKIFMATLINYYTGSAAETMNTDIRTAATANNCYLLDISAYGRMVLSDDAYSHCTAEGYYTLAEYFFKYISYIMHNNYTDFKTIQFTGTNRAYS